MQSGVKNEDEEVNILTVLKSRIYIVFFVRNILKEQLQNNFTREN